MIGLRCVSDGHASAESERAKVGTEIGARRAAFGKGRQFFAMFDDRTRKAFGDFGRGRLRDISIQRDKLFLCFRRENDRKRHVSAL